MVVTDHDIGAEVDSAMRNANLVIGQMRRPGPVTPVEARHHDVGFAVSRHDACLECDEVLFVGKGSDAGLGAGDPVVRIRILIQVVAAQRSQPWPVVSSLISVWEDRGGGEYRDPHSACLDDGRGTCLPQGWRRCQQA